MRLPAVPPVAPEPQARAHDRVHRAIRILVVDDNADHADCLGDLLRDDLGYETRVVYDGPSAIQAEAEFHPSVVLLDIGLPNMDGYEVARRLRNARSTAELVAVTGYGRPNDRERSMRAGFRAHLIKPVEIDTIAQLVKAIAAKEDVD